MQPFRAVKDWYLQNRESSNSLIFFVQGSNLSLFIPTMRRAGINTLKREL